MDLEKRNYTYLLKIKEKILLQDIYKENYINFLIKIFSLKIC